MNFASACRRLLKGWTALHLHGQAKQIWLQYAMRKCQGPAGPQHAEPSQAQRHMQIATASVMSAGICAAILSVIFLNARSWRSAPRQVSSLQGKLDDAVAPPSPAGQNETRAATKNGAHLSPSAGRAAGSCSSNHIDGDPHLPACPSCTPVSQCSWSNAIRYLRSQGPSCQPLQQATLQAG